MSAAVRLWHQSMTEIDGLGAYRDRLERHAVQLLGGDVTVDVHGLAPGSYGGRAPSEMLGYPYLHHVLGRQVPAAARRAEQQGYDAFVIGSFSEPYLREARCAVDIPVVSLNESTLLASCSLGRRAAFVANAPSVAGLVCDTIARHGAADRVAAVSAIDPGLTEPELLAEDPTAVLERFEAEARRLAALGADVLVPAEGVMCEVLYEAGLHRVDDVPVLDSVGVTWQHALFLLALRDAGTTVSRRAYPRAPDDAVAAIAPLD